MGPECFSKTGGAVGGSGGGGDYSGPADLALNAAMIVLNRVADKKEIELGGSVELNEGTVSTVVWESYQDFKSKFVGPCPREGGRVAWETLREWAETKLPSKDTP